MAEILTEIRVGPDGEIPKHPESYKQCMRHLSKAECKELNDIQIRSGNNTVLYACERLTGNCLCDITKQEQQEMNIALSSVMGFSCSKVVEIGYDIVDITVFDNEKQTHYFGVISIRVDAIN